MYKIKNQIEKDSFVIIRISDGCSFLPDQANTDYQAFLKYKEEGGKVYGADEEVPSEQTSV